MKIEGPPPYPATYSKYGMAAYNFASQQYEQRKAKCSGTGNRRMDVLIIYMTRAHYDAAMTSSAESLNALKRFFRIAWCRKLLFPIAPKKATYASGAP
jgi:hypothetical protein